MGQHRPKQSSGQGTGTIPASSIAQGSDDSMYLFKEGLQAVKHHTNATALYQSVLSGSLQEIQGVMNQSQNNTPDYEAFDASTYTGQCLAPVQAFWLAHPKHR